MKAARILAALGRRDGPPVVPVTGWSVWLTTLAAAAMAFLAVLALAGGIAASRLAAEWRADLAGVATVRLAPGADEATLAQVLETLRTTPGIASARPLSDAEQAALLIPWLGEGAGLDDLPAPRLIDVRVEGAGPDPAQLRRQLDFVAEGTVYDDHSAWRRPLARAAGALGWLSWAAILIVTLTAAGMVALAARASLAGNVEIVRVLRLIGAHDRFITRAFVGRLSARCGLGAFGGTALGLAALGALPSLGDEASLPVALLPGMAGFAAFLVLLPAASALIGWGIAHLSIRLALSDLP